ncbi:putative transposable element, partial [Pseudoloma neurophilia]
MSSIRLHPLQRVIDRAIRDVLGCSSKYCRKAAYEELRMPSMALRGRVIAKWL